MCRPRIAYWEGAITTKIIASEVPLCVSITLLRSLSIPFGSYGLVLSDTFAVRIEQADPILRFRIASLRH